MESGRSSGSSFDVRTGSPTNSSGGEQFNSEKKPGVSFPPFIPEIPSENDHFPFIPSAATTTNDQTNLQSNLHKKSSVNGDGNQTNRHMEAHSSNPFGEAYPPPLGNNSAPSSLSSSSQNPFLVKSDATNSTHVGAVEPEKVFAQVSFDEMPHSLLAPSKTSQGNPFQLPTSSSSTSETPVGAAGSQNVVDEHHHDHGHEWHHTLPVMEHHPPETYASHPMYTSESAQKQQDVATYEKSEGATSPKNIVSHHPSSVTEQGHNSMSSTSSNLGTNKKDEGASATIPTNVEPHHSSSVAEQRHGSMDCTSSNLKIDTAYDVMPETHIASSSSQQLGPLSSLESAQKQQDVATHEKNEGATIPTSTESHHTSSETGQGHNSMASTSSNLGTNTANVGEASVSIQDKKSGLSGSSFSPAFESSTQDPIQNSVHASSNSKEDTKVPEKLGKDSQLASESGDDDIPISSMPKHGQQSSDVAGSNSSEAVVHEKNKGSEIQNPPVQVMERPEDPAHRIPLSVFSRDKSSTQWSNASNESLFSIYTGNTSFSNDMAWWIKSGELDKQTPQLPQPPETKFNSISQSSAEQHKDYRVTEQKAVETMREVIMENSVSTKHTCEGDTAIRSNRFSNYNDHSQSNNSDGSTNSFAFKALKDGDKTLSSKRGEEKQKVQQKHSEMQNLKERSSQPQNPKSAPNVSPNRWLSCFACCH